MFGSMSSYSLGNISRRQFSAALGSAVLAAVFSQAHPQRAFAAESGKIAIVHTNDVHCAIDPAVDSKTGSVTSLGYAGVSAVYKEAQNTFGAENTILVDAGDFAQGKSTGTLTKGTALVELMNSTGYSFTTLGNHEFDFGIDQLLSLAAQANFDILCCNLVANGTGKNPFAPYAIKTLAGKKVAFVGITTPETLIKTNPTSIKDDQGNYLVGFYEDETGEALYAQVQATVDQARAEGAEFVVALAHLGQLGVVERYRSSTVVANTTGIDVVIDGHSHEIYSQTVANKAGQSVLITQKGTATAAVGRIVIDTNTTPATITAETILPPVDSDPVVAAAVAKVQAELDVVRGRKIAETGYFLRAHNDDGVTWAVRTRETNLGDLVADAYRVRMGAQIGLVNGGGVRADVSAGDITYGKAIDVNPFSNNLCLVKAKGSTILDGMEFDFRGFPGTSADIVQVSGLSFEVRTDIESSVEVDELGNFVKVAGERRIQNAKVGGVPLDPEATYTVASSVYILINGGAGRVMWKDAEVVVAEGVIDFQALSDYLEKDLAGVVGKEYANDYGQERIVEAYGPEPDPGPAAYLDSEPTAAMGEHGGSAQSGITGASSSAGMGSRLGRGSALGSASTSDGGRAVSSRAVEVAADPFAPVAITAVGGAFVAAAALAAYASAHPEGSETGC